MRIQIEPNLRLFVDIEGTQLVPDGPHMREKPTLILIHGGPGLDHSGYRPHFARMADICQVIYYDQRGHGRSDRCPEAQWTLDNFADDIVKLCDALGIEKPIVLGTSFGGFVAQRYIARHPEHPAKVILASTAPSNDIPASLDVFERLGGPEVRQIAARFWNNSDHESLEAYRRVCIPLYSKHKPENDHAARRRITTLEIFHAFSHGESNTFNFLPDLKKAVCPVLVMAGTDDPACPVSGARKIANALPPELVILCEFDKGRHALWMDDPEPVFASLREFILAK